MLKPILLTAPLLLLGGGGVLHAQDGGQLFTLYCSACHGTDGKGATGGQFPPLAGSRWVQGDAARAVKIALLGLHGPVDVEGRTFDLEMPPQGGTLDDTQIAAILTYVRGSWGNGSDAVSPEFVKNTRASLTRTASWTAAELLKDHPLPKPKPAIANLTSRVYHGQWPDIPDFTSLQPVNMEEEQSGLISMSQSDVKDFFGMVWEGDITAPETGAYVFRLDADDGARVIVDGKSLAEIHGLGPMNGSRAKEGKADLTAGPHKIRIEFFERTDNQGIQLGWSGPGITGWQNLSDTPLPPPKEKMLIKPVDGRAVVYRNFIAGVSPRGIGIGFPSGVNLAYSADHLAPELIWMGDFIDASRHWTDRGQGAEPPAGDHVVKLTSGTAIQDGIFRGYKQDKAGNPTFSVQIGDRYLLDTWTPEEKSLSRRLTLSKGTSTAPVEIVVSDQALEITDRTVARTKDGLGIVVKAPDPFFIKDGHTCIKIQPGMTIGLTYIWR